jgi:hypothetical protein
LLIASVIFVLTDPDEALHLSKYAELRNGWLSMQGAH